jgi:DNA polymerase type B, organellar and viral
MNPLKIFKLPLSFAGSYQFHLDFKKLNKNTSEDLILDNYRIKYLITFKYITSTEVEIIISLQEESSIVIYKFKDRLIVLPKLDQSEIIFERTIMSKSREIYIIDYLTKEILIIKKFNVNKSKGYFQKKKIDNSLNRNDLNKFITFDMEAITDLDSLDKEGNVTYFDPILISSYDFYYKQPSYKILNHNWQLRNLIHIDTIDELESRGSIHDKDKRNERIHLLQDFFLQFIDKKYHNFVLYAHNLSTFDGILILESIFYLCEDLGFKLEPLIRDNIIIGLKLRFGKMKGNRYRYCIEFHDSLLMLTSGLDKLAKTFLKDHPDIQKMSNKYLVECLLHEVNRKAYGDIRFINELIMYCERDSLSLAYIINKFSEIIFDKYKINVHKYPTISSLALAIYLTHYLESEELIPLISGEIYRDIKKGYHGGLLMYINYILKEKYILMILFQCIQLRC